MGISVGGTKRTIGGKMMGLSSNQEAVNKNYVFKLSFWVIGILLLFGPAIQGVIAQQKSGDQTSFIDQSEKRKQQLMKKMENQLGISGKDQFNVGSKIDLGSLADRFTLFEFDQMWKSVTGSDSRFNFPIYSPGIPAGDINGDGKNDLVVVGKTARDERTSDPGDNVSKTAVFYGGNTSTTPDQLLYNALMPVGDLNNDGFSDAVATNVDGSGTLYAGSSAGFLEAPVSVDVNPANNFVGFMDLNGDGFTDFIEYYPYDWDGTIDVYYGGSDLSTIGSTSFTLNGLGIFSSFSLNVRAGDLNNDGTDELVVFDGSPNMHIIDASSTATLLQSTSFPELDWAVTGIFFHILDLDADNYDEIFVTTSPIEDDSTKSFYFKQDTSQQSVSVNPSELLHAGLMYPLGDIDNDGPVDFALPSQKSIGFGNTDITVDITADQALPPDTDSDWDLFIDNSPYGVFGDMDGDGISDAVIGHVQFTEETSGRRYITGDASRSFPNTFTHFSWDNFFARVAETRNIGDFNGDGTDDLAIPNFDKEEVEVYFGANPLGGTPDMLIDLGYNPIGIDGGDFNGDGISDIIVSDNIGQQMNMYLGSSSPDAAADLTLDPADFQSITNPAAYWAETAGDVNNDGFDDFLLTSIFARDDSSNYLNEAYLFYGGSTLPSTPDVTIQLDPSGNLSWAGWTTGGLGDVNGDGIDDFGVSLIGVNNEDGSEGRAHVYFGASSPDYSSPDLVLLPNHFSHVGYSNSITGGDYNGDGINDIAVSSNGITSWYEGTVADAQSLIHIYNGGSDIDNKLDHGLHIPGNAFGSYFTENFTEKVFVNYGQLSTIPDFDKDGSDELMLGTSIFGTNAAVFMGNFNEKQTPSILLEAPNEMTGLGYEINNAVGDFDANGTPDLVLTQSFDNNDAYRSSRVYRFELTRPINIASIADVPDDQGDWVRVTIDGFLMDGLNADVHGFDHWAVWRKTSTGKWTNVATVPAYTESADFVDVHVPRTKPTGAEPDSSNNFTFKVTANDFDKNMMAESDEMSGFALDNVAPPAVHFTSVDRNDSSVTITWAPSPANDLDKYNIFVGNLPSTAGSQTKIGTTNGTSITLKDSQFNGLNFVAVKAEDVHKNVGTVDFDAEAVFPIALDYSVSTDWNMIGASLDENSGTYSDLVDQIKEGTLYDYYDGIYQVADQMAKGRGYWAKFPVSATHRLTGLPVVRKTYELKEGWNIIAGPGGTMKESHIIDLDNILIDGTLLQFDGAYTGSSNLTKGNAYWIRTSKAGNITLDLATSRLIESEAPEEKVDPLTKAKEQFNRVEFKDSEGHTQALFFGAELPENVDKRSFSLPPVPPGKVFDVRIAGSDMRLTEEDKVDVQLSRIRGTDISVSLDLTDIYPHRSFVVRELVKGEVVAAHELREGESIQLRDPATDMVTLSPSIESLLANDQKPEKFDLFQNYPNPFNPSTVIQYALPEAAEVRLEVFNLLGRKVATLVNSEQQAGFHKVTFDAAELASGVYLYRLQAGTYQKTNKLILIK